MRVCVIYIYISIINVPSFRKVDFAESLLQIIREIQERYDVLHDLRSSSPRGYVDSKWMRIDANKKWFKDVLTSDSRFGDHGPKNPEILKGELMLQRE